MKKNAKRRACCGSLAVSAAAICLQLSNHAQAGTETWTADNGNWDTASNWNNGAGPVPGSGDTVYITNDDGTSRTITYNASGVVELQSLTIDNYGVGTNTLSMSDPQVLEADNEYLGDSNTSVKPGWGVVTQTTGINNAADGLYLGYGADDEGFYNLNGTGALQAADEFVGYDGGGTVTQNAGMNIATSLLYVGHSAGSSGNYSLNGGTLSAPNDAAEFVGFSGSGTFDQTGGTNTVGTDLILAQNSGSSGSYTLGNTAQLSTDNEYIGTGGSGTFTQKGGTNTTTTLNVGFNSGSTGEYTLTGTGVLSASNEIIGSNSTGDLNQSGGTNTVTGTLTIGSTSSATVGIGSYELTSGALSTGTEIVNGTFTQSGGNSTVNGNLEIAASNGGSSGAGGYSLQGTGSLSVTGNEIVGQSVAGTFSQTGGTHTIGGSLVIGAFAGSSGSTYNLGGTGSLKASAEYVGSEEEGFLLQTTGTNTVINDLIVGGNDDVAGGTAELYLEGGTITVGGLLRLWPDQSEMYITSGSVTAGDTENQSLIDQQGGTSSLGDLSGTGNIVVGYSGQGATPSSMTVTSLRQNSVDIESSGTLTLLGGASNNTITDLTINGGMFNITNGHIFIDYGSGPDPIASIAALIATGYADGAWDGPGIMSTVAQANSGSYGIGYADSADPGNPADLSSGTIEIMYTLLGDANLDGKVNGADFTLMATHFNDSVTNGWDEGDFNYDGKVNGADFVLLAENFNQFASQSDVSAADLKALDSFAAANGISLANVPEPTSIGLISLAGLLLQRRRPASRRNQRCACFESSAATS